jgi:hypothetical protein
MSSEAQHALVSRARLPTMQRSTSAPISVLAALALGLFVITSSTDASSQAVSSNADVARLTQRIEQLESRLSKLEITSQCEFPYELAGNGVFRAKPQCVDTESEPSKNCTPPFRVDSRGIKLIRPECY